MSQQAEITDLKKKVLATGIRVGTDMKTKSKELDLQIKSVINSLQATKESS